MKLGASSFFHAPRTAFCKQSVNKHLCCGHLPCCCLGDFPFIFVTSHWFFAYKARTVSKIKGRGEEVMALCHSNKLLEALNVFKIAPDNVGASVLIAAFGATPPPSNLDKSFYVFNTLLQAKVPPTLPTLRALLSACIKVGQPQRGLSLATHLDEHGLIPDAVCFGLLVTVWQSERSFTGAPAGLQVAKGPRPAY